MLPLLSRSLLAALVLTSCRLWAADDLPKRAPGETADSESKLMLDDLPDLTQGDPGKSLSATTSVVTVEQAKAELDRARARQQQWQKLARSGVVSQVEAESTALQVARAVVKYQTALAAQSAAQVALLQARRARGEITAGELADAQATQRSTAALAVDAALNLQRQLRLAAEANLDRQRRLLAVGATTKSEVKRAEEKLAALPPR